MFTINFDSALTIPDLTALMEGADISSGIDTVTSSVDSGLTSLAGCMPDICNLSGTISGMLSNASDSITDSIKGSIGDAAKQFQSSMGDLTKNMAVLVQAVKEMFEKTKGIISGLISSMSELSELVFLDIKALLTDLVVELNSSITAIQDTMSGAIDSATSAISTTAKEILNGVNSLITMKCPIANDAIDSAVNTKGLENLKSVVSTDNIADGISSAFGNIGSSIGSMNSSVPTVNDISGPLQAKLTEITTWIDNA